MKMPLAVKALVSNLGLLKEFIYPRKCAVCHKVIDAGCLCEICRKGFLLQRHRRYESPLENYLNKNIPLAAEDVLTDLYLLYKYDGVFKQLIRQLKFENRYDLIFPLREELEQALPHRLQKWLECFDYVSCIPTSPERLEQRGYDIPQEIFGPLLHSASCLYVPALLLRQKKTAPLFNLKQEERRQELQGCFSVNGRYSVNGSNILLCDDIYTTGSTFIEAAAALKRAGAKSVTAVAFTAAKENW